MAIAVGNRLRWINFLSDQINALPLVRVTAFALLVLGLSGMVSAKLSDQSATSNGTQPISAPTEQQWFLDLEAPYSSIGNRHAADEPHLMFACHDEVIVLTSFFDLRSNVSRALLARATLDRQGGSEYLDFAFHLSNGVVVNVPMRVIDRIGGTPFGFTSTAPGVVLTPSADVYELTRQLLRSNLNITLFVERMAVLRNLNSHGFRYLEHEVGILSECL
ncbi:hypothetical protein [Roseicyclus elongatus]|uniref:hypothetical protein n=1 Tax=Roseicyclus elongatus TaxID=159346 RepID=UPI0012EC9266|nr:hypothetical protein [Roseibacterium elongatum]